MCTEIAEKFVRTSVSHTPIVFSVWDILTRVPEGIVICGQHLPQQPTLSELTVHELSFALKIEFLLSRIPFPEYRHLMVELLMVIDVILRRNAEFSFSSRVDLDEVNYSRVAAQFIPFALNQVK